MLSVRDFWRDFSKRQFHLEAVKGLPETLSYAALLDQLFGKLTRHQIISLERQQIVVDCLHCNRIHEAPGDDACETHIGIVQGQFERRFGNAFRTNRSITGNICQLKLNSTLSSHEK